MQEHETNIAVAKADAVQFSDCPTGLFLYQGQLCFKTPEMRSLEALAAIQADAFIVQTGEYFWGPAEGKTDRDGLLVHPVTLA